MRQPPRPDVCLDASDCCPHRGRGRGPHGSPGRLADALGVRPVAAGQLRAGRHRPAPARPARPDLGAVVDLRPARRRRDPDGDAGPARSRSPPPSGPAWLLKVFRGAESVWDGTLAAPARASGAWTLAANGIGTYGNSYVADWDGVNFGLQQIINRARGDPRRLLWETPGDLNTGYGLDLSQQFDSCSKSITDAINGFCAAAGKTWEITRRQHLLRIFPMPDLTRPTRLLIAPDPPGRTLAGYYDTLYLRHQVTADGGASGRRDLRQCPHPRHPGYQPLRLPRRLRRLVPGRRRRRHQGGGLGARCAVRLPVGELHHGIRGHPRPGPDPRRHPRRPRHRAGGGGLQGAATPTAGSPGSPRKPSRSRSWAVSTSGTT